MLLDSQLYVHYLDDLVPALSIGGDDLAPVVGGNPAHVVVDGGQDGDRLPRHVHAGKDHGRLGDSRQAGLTDMIPVTIKIKKDSLVRTIPDFKALKL